MAPEPAEKVTLKDLVNQTPFHIVFNGNAKVRVTTVSSADLAAAVGAGTKLYDVTLATLRNCGKLSKRYLFCMDDANTTVDTTSLGYYISLTKDNITALQQADADSDTPVLLTVQYTFKYRPPDQIPSAPGTPGVDNNSSGATNTGVEGGGSTGEAAAAPVVVQTSGMVAGSDQIVSTHPASMNEQEWNYVMITNSLLHGLVFDDASSTLQEARGSAFQLKKSYSDPFESPAGTSPSFSAASGAQFCIPAFQVTDNSSVTITEIKSTLQLSMAQNAFTSWSVEASASGGCDGITAGLSASGGFSSSNSSNSTDGSVVDSLHASYNFPRVKVFLDADDLELSANCKALLDKIKTGQSLADVATFRRKYGHVFACSVQLGGRLHSTRDSSSFTATTTHAKKEAMKLAAGANVSSPFASASGSASYGHGSGSQSTTTSQDSSEGLTWEAQGGETLLSSNPPAWITTVGSFYNWRVIERGDVRNILKVLQDICSEDWPNIFNGIENPPQTQATTQSSDSNPSTHHQIGMGG